MCLRDSKARRNKGKKIKLLLFVRKKKETREKKSLNY